MRPLAATSRPRRSLASGSTVCAGMYSASITTGERPGEVTMMSGRSAGMAGDGLRVLGADAAAGLHGLQQGAEGVVGVRLGLAWHTLKRTSTFSSCAPASFTATWTLDHQERDVGAGLFYYGRTSGPGPCVLIDEKRCEQASGLLVRRVWCWPAGGLGFLSSLRSNRNDRANERCDRSDRGKWRCNWNHGGKGRYDRNHGTTVGRGVAF